MLSPGIEVFTAISASIGVAALYCCYLVSLDHSEEMGVDQFVRK